MGIYRKIICIFFAFCLAVSFLPQKVLASSQSYIYDNWGRSIPTPSAYTVDEIYSGQSFGLNAFEELEDIFVSEADEIYIVDKGQSKIIVLTKDFKLARVIEGFYDQSGLQSFSQPSGIFTDAIGNIFVADSGNQRVVKLDKDLKLIKEFTRPDTDLIDENAEFRPLKVVVDSVGNVYVVCYGIYQGLVKYDENGVFQGFFGGNRVEVTPSLLIRHFWKKMFTDEQAQSTVRFLPIEYSNAAIDSSGFIYAVVMQTLTSLDEIKKLNSLGNNVLRFTEIGTHYPRNDFGDIEKDYTTTTTFKDNRIVDVAVGNDGTMAILDGERGHVFVYDQDCNLLFVFGRKGSNRGEFGQPVSIARLGDNYLVADSAKKCVMVFRPTEYAKLVMKSMSYYSDGKYIESISLWEEVLKKNANYAIAYKSIGKAYLQQGKYKEAMSYFKNANDKEGYSQAFAEYRKEFVRKYFLYISICVVVAVLIIKRLLKLVLKAFGFNAKKVKTVYR